MARCGCTSTTCSCAVKGGPGVVITGVGTNSNPYVVNIDAGKMTVDDTPTIDMTLTGSGTSADYYHVSARLTAKLDDLTDVTSPSPASGNVLAWNGTQWTPVPPVTAAPGAINAGNGITGDGSAGSPITAKPNPALGIQVDVNGIGLQSGVMATINGAGATWQSYTPKLYTSAGVAVGSTSPIGRYVLRNKVCIVIGSLIASALATNACVTLPVPAAQRFLNCGSMVAFGTGLPADQSGVGRIQASNVLDRLVLVALTNGFRDLPSGASLAWSVVYETA